MDFEDSGHHLLIWNITFQTPDRQTVRCQLPHGAGFVKFAGLENLKPYELDQRTDFSSLPWFKITIQEGKTVGLRDPRPQYRLVGWERTETKSADRDRDAPCGAPLPHHLTITHKSGRISGVTLP
jgi:hypothetical protein